MRIRSVKPDFWRDEVTGLMEPGIALFYLGIASYADDDGRFEWNAALIRADIDPYDAKWGGIKGVEKRLEQLATLKRVFRYVADGRTYGVIPTQKRHQKPNRPTESRLPPPPVILTESSVSKQCGHTAGEGEEKEMEEEKVAASAAASPPLLPADESPVVALLPCVGEGPKEYAVTEAAVVAFADAHPGIDVRGELRKARLWLDANPTKRKTHKGVPRFLLSWMGRAQDGGGGRAAAGGAQRPHGMIASGKTHEGKPW